jgi:hypothetical protein
MPWRKANEIGKRLLWLLLPSPVNDGLLVEREPSAFVEQGADLALKLASGPIASEALDFIERPLPGINKPHQFLKMRPGKP